VQYFCDEAQSQEFSHVLRWRSLSSKWRTGNFTKGRKLFRCEHVGWIRCHGDIVPRGGRMFKGARRARTVNCTITDAAAGMTRVWRESGAGGRRRGPLCPPFGGTSLVSGEESGSARAPWRLDESALGPPPEIRESEFRPPLKGEVGLGVYGAVCAGRFGLRVGGSRIRAKCAFRDDEGLSVEHAKAALL
jgi:hypothetical protein